MSCRRALLAVGACAVLAAAPVRAQNLGLSFDGPNLDWTSSTMWSLGWEFNVLSPLWVTALGVFDDADIWYEPLFPHLPNQGPNGLTEDHEVGIWDPFGTLLASATVSAGGGTVHNYFRFTAITPFLLAMGNGYRIASTTGTSKFTSGTYLHNLVTHPDLQIVQGRYVASSGLADPTEVDPYDFYVGPNMMFSSVPEPGTVVLLATGLAGVSLGAMARRRRRTDTRDA